MQAITSVSVYIHLLILHWQSTTVTVIDQHKTESTCTYSQYLYHILIVCHL